MKTETFCRKFNWRIAKKIIVQKNGHVIKETFVVQRQSIIFGIPFWWTFGWEKYEYDGVNFNITEHDTKQGAEDQLAAQQLLRSYGHQMKTIFLVK